MLSSLQVSKSTYLISKPQTHLSVVYKLGDAICETDVMLPAGWFGNDPSIWGFVFSGEGEEHGIKAIPGPLQLGRSGCLEVQCVLSEGPNCSHIRVSLILKIHIHREHTQNGHVYDRNLALFPGISLVLRIVAGTWRALRKFLLIKLSVLKLCAEKKEEINRYSIVNNSRALWVTMSQPGLSHTAYMVTAK